MKRLRPERGAGGTRRGYDAEHEDDALVRTPSWQHSRLPRSSCRLSSAATTPTSGSRTCQPGALSTAWSPACLIIVVSKLLGKLWLTRSENYYEP